MGRASPCKDSSHELLSRLVSFIGEFMESSFHGHDDIWDGDARLGRCEVNAFPENHQLGVQLDRFTTH